MRCNPASLPPHSPGLDFPVSVSTARGSVRVSPLWLVVARLCMSRPGAQEGGVFPRIESSPRAACSPSRTGSEGPGRTPSYVIFQSTKCWQAQLRKGKLREVREWLEVSSFERFPSRFPSLNLTPNPTPKPHSQRSSVSNALFLESTESTLPAAPRPRR